MDLELKQNFAVPLFDINTQYNGFMLDLGFCLNCH